MKKINILFLPLFLISLTSIAGSFNDEAKIVSVEKVYQDHTIREPYQDCYIKEFYESNNNNVSNPLGGALLGGIIGKQLDDDDSNTGAVVGALLGASMAQNSESNSGNVVRKEVCETKYRRVQSDRLAHYRVTYEYDGQEFSYTTRRKPSSDTVKVRVRVIPQ